MPFDPFFSASAKLPVRPLSADAKELFDKAVQKDLKKTAIRPPKHRFDSTPAREREIAAYDALADTTIRKPI